MHELILKNLGCPDAILGVSVFGDLAPDEFGAFDLAFITVGKTEIPFHSVTELS